MMRTHATIIAPGLRRGRLCERQDRQHARALLPSLLLHTSTVGVGTSPGRTLEIVLRGRCRTVAPVGVIEVPRVQLAKGSALDIPEGETSAVTSPHNENKILVTPPITGYAFSQTGLRKSGPCGAV